MNKNKRILLAISIILVLAIIATIAYGITITYSAGASGEYFAYGEISQINITQSAVDAESGEYSKVNVHIVQGDEFSVVYDGANPHDSVEIAFENGVVSVDIETQKNFLSGILFFSAVSSTVTITIPQDSENTDLSISIDGGTLLCEYIETHDFSIDGGDLVVTMYGCNVTGETNIYNYLGNITILDSDFGDFAVKAETSNLKLEEVTFGDIDIYTNMGNIEMKYATFSESAIYSYIGIARFEEVSLECMVAETVNGEIYLSITDDLSQYACYYFISESGIATLADDVEYGYNSEKRQLIFQTYIGDVTVIASE